MKRWLCIGFLIVSSLKSATADTLDQKIFLERSRGSVYELLQKVSERAQIMFIYEKGVVRNEQRVKIASGHYTLREAILLITGEKEMQMRVIGNYLLLYKDAKEPPATPLTPMAGVASGTIVEGYVKERQTQEPVPYCYIALEGSGVGTVSNSDGRFALKVPDSLLHTNVLFNHIGYHSPKIPLSVFLDSKPQVFLDPLSIQLQEVVVRYVPAQKIIREMLENRTNNYAKDPACFTSFYREGVEYEGDFASLTEGVCQIYKSGLGALDNDQVKLLKMRNIHNKRYPDSILVKIQAGVRASLSLDIMHHIPDFLAFDRDQYFSYVRVGMERIDSGMVHVISFEQKREVKEPLYTGMLYIDVDNKALIKAEFEINPHYIKQAGPTIITKKSKSLDIEVQRVLYSVSYQRWNEHYWMNHVRGDLQFKIKRKKGLFGSAKKMNAYFEMATCEIDTDNVKRFSNRERLPTGQIFSQTHFEYDSDFWEQFNTIVPEQKITEAITKLLLTVEKQQSEEK